MMMLGIENGTVEQKIRFIQGYLYAAGNGEQLVVDNKVRMFYHIVDAAGADLTGAKTIDAIAAWLKKERDKGE